MPHCPDCGAEDGEGAAFCRSCGGALNEPAADSSVNAASGPAQFPSTNDSPINPHDGSVPVSAVTEEAPPTASDPVTLPPPDQLRTRLQGMDDYEFEHFVADLWERMGWRTEVSRASNDAGIDVVAEKETPYPQKKLIQAKRYSDSTTVGGPDVQQYASLRQQEPDADSVVVVTTSQFTTSAEKRAEDLNVKLVDGDALV